MLIFYYKGKGYKIKSADFVNYQRKIYTNQDNLSKYELQSNRLIVAQEYKSKHFLYKRVRTFEQYREMLRG